MSGDIEVMKTWRASDGTKLAHLPADLVARLSARLRAGLPNDGEIAAWLRNLRGDEITILGTSPPARRVDRIWTAPVCPRPTSHFILDSRRLTIYATLRVAFSLVAG